MNFRQSVIEQSQFLFEIGFTVGSLDKDKKYSDYLVNFISEKVGIQFVYDRGQALVKAGNINENDANWFELTDIVHAYAPDVEYIYFFPEKPIPLKESVSPQIERIAYLLRTYCKEFLSGDFTKANEIKILEEKRSNDLLNYLNSLHKLNK